MTATNKGLLLLQRERELYDLRRLRNRAEEWLAAIFGLSPGLSPQTLQGCSETAVDLLIDEMGFEAAAVVQYVPTQVEPVFLQTFPPCAPRALELTADQKSFLDREPNGLCNGSPPPQLKELFGSLGWKQVLWFWASDHGQSQFLVLTGRSEKTARLHDVTLTDAKHFCMFAGHFIALLSGALLMSDLAKERQELRSTNRQLDEKLNELTRVQKQVIESSAMVARASRQAGMAEVATGILHNVGNALNGVATCADVVEREAERLDVQKLQRLLALLAEQPDLAIFFSSDPRAKTVMPYFSAVVSNLASTEATVRGEILQLQEKLDHIRNVVARQQQFAKHGVAEKCSLSALMDDALILSQSSRHDQKIQVKRDFEEACEVVTDKHRVLQVLVNLITNAMQSLTACSAEDKCLTARVRRASQTFVLEVEDNGVGIAPEAAHRIFKYGFTTRTDGHGFGLHTCQLTAKEIGGTLSFTSDGENRGAIFSLSLPAERGGPGTPNTKDTLSS